MTASAANLPANWHRVPPPGRSVPIVRVGSIDFNSTTPIPAIGLENKICNIRTGHGEYLVIHHVEVQAAILVGGIYQRLAPEAAHGMLYWTLKATQREKDFDFSTGSKDEEIRAPGIGMFGALSVEQGSMAPIIISPGASVDLIIVHTAAGGPAGVVTVPTNSKISGFVSGYKVSAKDGKPAPMIPASELSPALPTPRPAHTTPNRPAARPPHRPVRK